MLLDIALHPTEPTLAVQVGKMASCEYIAIERQRPYNASGRLPGLAHRMSTFPAVHSGILLLFWGWFSSA